jgi:N utilization substance protein B
MDAINASTAEHLHEVKDGMVGADGFTEKERDAALELAASAFESRKSADEVMRELAPTWPAHRQAAVDRAILRLGYYELTTARVSPKIVINEAIELARAFSTERSPAFVNALLDKVRERIGASSPDDSQAVTESSPSTHEER